MKIIKSNSKRGLIVQKKKIWLSKLIQLLSPVSVLQTKRQPPTTKTTTRRQVQPTMATESYDRAKEVKQFDDSKIGVKGLVDSGVTAIPRFFIHPPETLADLRRTSLTTRPDPHVIPTIDLAGVDSGLLRPAIVEKIARASRELGFFQIVNHGIGEEALERVIGAIKGFHEQPTEVKAKVYRRETNTGVSFLSNIDLFQSKAASWRYKP